MTYRSPATQRGHHRGRAAPNAGKKYPAEILTREEARALIRQCSSRAPTGIRNRALLTTMYSGGLRISEALALHAKDVDPDAGTIAVLHGKGDRRRTVGIDDGAMAVLERWIDHRPALGLTGRQPLFCTLAGQPLKSSYVRTLLPRLAAKAGVEKRTTPHTLRHTHAAELAAEGVPVNLIQEQLGHSSLATTSRYLQHIAPRQLIEAMQSREWTP